MASDSCPVFKTAAVATPSGNFKLAFKGSRINFFNCDTRKPDELSKFINFFKKKIVSLLI